VNSQLEQQAERWLSALNLQRALGGLAVIVFLIAWNRGIALLYGTFALIVGVLAVAWLVPRWNLRGITAERRLPAKATEGDPIAIEASLATTSRRPRFMLEVADTLPFASEDDQQPTTFFPRVQRHSTLHYRINCELRGLHTVGPLVVRTSYPLGIATASRTLPDTTTQILVYPSAFSITDLPLFGGGRWPTAGAKAVSRAGGNDEFFAVREYREGDSARHIHWPATARRGKLVVREHEYLHATDVMLALDLRRDAQFGRGKHSTLEYMVKIAASIAHFALEHGHGVGLIGYGTTAIEVPMGRGPRHYQAILEVLARVEAAGETPYERIVDEALARVPLGGVLATFDIPAGDNAPPPVTGAYRRHVRVIPITFDSASFDPTGGRRSHTPQGGYRVRCGDDLARVFGR
jgi:uncharacterized protein (DUF58 family)